MPFIRRDVLPHVPRVSAAKPQQSRTRRGESLRKAAQLRAHHRYDNASVMRRVSVFEKENTLPRSKLHTRICDRDHFARSRQHHPNVRRHVVRSFIVVLEVRRVFGHEPVEEVFEIATRGWIRVLHDDEAATGVLDENSQRARDDTAAGQDLENLVGNFIGPFTGGADGDRLGVDAQGRHGTTCETLRIGMR